MRSRVNDYPAFFIIKFLFLQAMLPLSLNRNRTADLLKGIAVIFMIQVHLVELFAEQHIFESLIGHISLFLGGPAAAPVFMAVMGYYIVRSKKSTLQSIIRGIKIILLGFALNIGLNLHLLIKIASGIIKLDPLPYVFGVDILFLAGLSIIFLSLFKIIQKHRLVIVVLTLIIILLLNYYLGLKTELQSPYYLTVFFYGKGIWWSYFPFIPWVSYSLLGFIFFIVQGNISAFIVKYLWVIIVVCLLVVVSFISFADLVTSNLQSYYHHDFLFFIYTTFFLAGWASLAYLLVNHFSNSVFNYIEWLGKNVTVVYVIQWLIIGNIATSIYKTQNIIETFVWFIIILGLTSAGVWVWNKRATSIDRH